ncbi:MAG: DNA-3-methyladenine glycosylase I [Bacteroidota bacterium]
MVFSDGKKRCGWPSSNPLMIDYHDHEWGVPIHDDRKLFEFMILDAVQAGLSWEIVLKKRENFRKAFHNFNPVRIARYKARDTKRLLADPGIIRNRLKINAAVLNARQFLMVQQEFGSFDSYIWQFTDGKMLVHRYRRLSQLPAISREAETMSRDLKRRGFTFVGPKICYSFMQAAGMVNDHLVDCYRYLEVQKMK